MKPSDLAIANAILGVDTLWGGDVMCASGTGRFIADSWFSDEPLPEAYTLPSAKAVREAGGVTGKDHDAVKRYLGDFRMTLIHSMDELAAEARRAEPVRAAYLEGLHLCLWTMWELAMETFGQGPAVPYERAVIASTGRPPEPSNPAAKKDLLAKLLGKEGFAVSTPEQLLASVDAWRKQRVTPMASVRALSDAVIAYFDALCVKNLMPYLPKELATVPRANIDFLPIKDAWFSGSMNYVGRKRNPDGSPQYEATYEINASLEISVPEFQQLISHEVVPGHVTTFAYLQNLYTRGKFGIEGTVLTMNTRAATLFEGLANNAILIAHGATEIDQLPDDDMKVGVLLALLQDDAKNQSSYLTWHEKREQPEVAKVLRNEFLVSEERAQKLSGAWGKHPLLGRMYLPAYRSGTVRVAELRRKHAPEKVLPALYGCRGLVDIETIEKVL